MSLRIDEMNKNTLISLIASMTPKSIFHMLLTMIEEAEYYGNDECVSALLKELEKNGLKFKHYLDTEVWQ